MRPGTSASSAARIYLAQLERALKHLDYSYAKVSKLPTDPEKLDEETLETWEGFSSRFARCVDLFLTKFVKAKVLEDDPGFSGTLRDFVNQGEKLGLVTDGARWMELRELRNIEAHTYEEDLGRFLAKLRKAAPEVLKLKSSLALSSKDP